MKSNIRRINLSFDLTRDKDREVYNMIQEHSSKTAYVIEEILAFNDRSKIQQLSRQDIKEVVKEALLEMNFYGDKEENKEKDICQEIVPDNIFELFDKL